MAPGQGLLEIGVGLVDGVGEFSASLDHRIDEAVSVFASGDLDVEGHWSTMGGLRMRW